jgi:hypothetical protein
MLDACTQKNLAAAGISWPDGYPTGTIVTSTINFNAKNMWPCPSTLEAAAKGFAIAYRASSNEKEEFPVYIIGVCASFCETVILRVAHRRGAEGGVTTGWLCLYPRCRRRRRRAIALLNSCEPIKQARKRGWKRRLRPATLPPVCPFLTPAVCR